MELGKFIPVLCMILGLTKPSAAVDQNCNYAQKVEPGLTYYVYNPSFPQYYTGEHSCLWRVTSDFRIKLNCSNVIIPGSLNCSRDALVVQVQDNIEYRLCGLKSFVVESVSTEMNIKFYSKFYSPGGKFTCELTAIEEECNCGRRNPNRIVGGVETGVNEFPMMAGLVDYEKGIVACGATIITMQHVITAAHCVYQSVDNIQNWSILVGDHNLATGGETNATKLYLVESITLHPNYQGPTTKNDVAIVKSKQKFIFSMQVGPVCLPFRYTQTNFTGSTVTALGWGSLRFGGKPSKVLMKVDLSVVSQTRCSKDYDDITDKKICTYGDQKDTCQFDSGGPVLWYNQRSNRMMLVGVISYGKTCADGIPSVNTRVTSILDFIQSVTRGYHFCNVL